MSMRKQIFDQGDDSLIQMIFYRFDLYQNTGYTCLVYALNIYMIFGTNDVLDVILNSLAIEFIYQMDEGFVMNEWWDPEKRWLKAGAVNLVLQSTLRLKKLSDPAEFCAEYGIKMEELKEATHNNKSCMKSMKMAKADRGNTKCMTNEEVKNYKLGKLALKTKNKNAIKEFVKKRTKFGATSTRGWAIFWKYENFRTWSYWDKVLFLPEVPDMTSTFNKAKTDKIKSEVNVVGGHVFKNHDHKAGTNEMKQFLVGILNVLVGYNMLHSVFVKAHNKNYSAAMFTLLDGCVEWFMFLVQLLFPLFILGSLVAVPVCY